MSHSADSLKHLAALRAIEYVNDSMVVGLGTGTTAMHATIGLGERVRGGLKITGVPTSDATAELARQHGIDLNTLDEVQQISLTIDGADEVDLSTFNVIKGRGGALLREKLVAVLSREEILIVDESKIVERLGEKSPLPVEVVRFGWASTMERLRHLGCAPQLRKSQDGTPYLTDADNYIIDCKFSGINDPESLAASIKGITGVVEHGLFIGLATRIIIAGSGGVQVVDR